MYTLREEFFARRNFRGKYFRELNVQKLRIRDSSLEDNIFLPLRGLRLGIITKK